MEKTVRKQFTIALRCALLFFCCFVSGVGAQTEPLGGQPPHDAKPSVNLYIRHLAAAILTGGKYRSQRSTKTQGTLNYSDNHARGIEKTGSIILDLIPKVNTSW
jgi:hypothetical protein